MAERAVAPRPDVSDMYAVHGVFRDAFGAVPELVGGVEPGDAERMGLIANYYENILSFLEAHHDAEDELVFPLLRARCTDQSALIGHIAGQHEEALRLLQEAKSSLAALPAGDAAAQKAAEERLGRLYAQLVEHLDEEEAEVLPLAAANLSMEEWGALPGHGFANFHGDKIWLILGLIRERMNDGQRSAMLEHMPPPAVEMWTGFGEQAFRDYSSVVAVEVASRVPDPG